MVPYQKWCGQTQPHNSHIWADIRSNSIGLNLQCAGYSAKEIAFIEMVEKEENSIGGRVVHLMVDAEKWNQLKEGNDGA